jgi:hypothetical protein
MKLDDVATVVGMSMKAAIKPVSAQIATLEARVNALEQSAGAGAKKPYVKFCGTWKPSELAFDPGDAVVHHSALWICKAETKGEPGVDFVGWQLAIKSPPRK